jgi:hypothetical protein
MTDRSKQISNPFSNGSGGAHFENRVQTSFAILMLTGGFSPCLPTWPIIEIKLQGKYDGYETDDLIVYCEEPISRKKAKLIGQIKHSINITNGDGTFGEVIQAAWSDFNNPKIFTEGSDVIALICGPLSGTDTNSVRPLLEQARSSKNSEDFVKRIERGKFTSNDQREKLKVFKTHLKSANNETDLTNDELFRFLRSFHLLIYDLDIKGVVLSLIHTLIEQYSPNNANSLWSQMYDHVSWVNKKAGFITISSMPEEISSLFKIPQKQEIPKEFIRDTIDSIPPEKIDWNSHPMATELTLACLLGSWNDNSIKDKEIISQLAGQEYINWISKLRELLQLSASPIEFNNGIWKVRDRQKLFETLSSRIFDDHLDDIKNSAITILAERDPKFELPQENRFAANIYGKIMQYSNQIRKGLAESLAIISYNKKLLKYCSTNKKEVVVILTLRDIFKDADWVLWASLSDLLPLLAESAPDEFLEIVDNNLQINPCPFDNIYSQEGGGITGWNYMTGLIWSLETLAWEENYLVRATYLLGGLANRDPGGKWINRPINSLTTIFLPWLFQTLATFDKRKVAISTLEKEYPEIEWKLVLSLLPRQHQISSGTHRPKIRKSIPQDWTNKVSVKEYRDQIEFYADLAVEKSTNNQSRLSELIKKLDNLPITALDKLLSYLTSEEIISKSAEFRSSLWNNLVTISSKHKRFSTADWAFDPKIIERIDKVADTIRPENPLFLYERLFNGHDADHFEKKGDYDNQFQILINKRKEAVGIVLATNGIDGIIHLLARVDSTSSLGFSLGSIANDSIDDQIFLIYLKSKENRIEQFIRYYIWGRFNQSGWDWVDKELSKINPLSDIAQYCIYLPFTLETWQRVTTKLGDSESIYWQNTIVNPYVANCELTIAIDKLIEYGRPYSAIDCLYKEIDSDKLLDKPRIIKALMSATTSSEITNTMTDYYITEIIKALQEDGSMDLIEMSNIEWNYIDLLDEPYGVSPKTLENRLSNDSSFFCEVIRITFQTKSDSEKEKELTHKEISNATHAWELLRRWELPPGLQSNGNFDEDKFKKWFNDSWNKSKETGHLDTTLYYIGKVLFYFPKEPTGFWMNTSIAEVLDRADTQEIRNGYYDEVFNSIGAHAVDPSGKPELDNSTVYLTRAKETEDAGYPRFANTLRKVSESFKHDAKRISEEHGKIIEEE